MICPVCKKHDWCLVSDDGTQAICARIQEGSIRKIGEAGYLFNLNGQGFAAVIKVQKSVNYAPDTKHVMKMYCSLNFAPEALKPLATHLGVSVDSLQNLGCGKSPKSWNFPMYNAKKEMIGIKRRNLEGNKWCVRHSKLGVYLPRLFDMNKPAIICEGESDTAAMLSMGYNAIGRASAMTCRVILSQFLNPALCHIIVADNDKNGIGGKEAFKLRDKLCKACVIFPPAPYKDARQWCCSGQFTNKEFIKLSHLAWKGNYERLL
jgi:hypothetical protein